METLVWIGFGLITGAVIGALIMQIVKPKSSSSDAELRVQLDASQKNLDELNRISDGHKREADTQRARAEKQEKLVVQLQERSQASQERFDSVEQANGNLQEQVEHWRKHATEIDNVRTELQAQLGASTKRVNELAETKSGLEAQVADWQKKASVAETENAELSAKLDAANKRLDEQTDIEKTLKTQFQVMVNDALSQNNDAFIKAADEKIGTLVKQAKSDFSLSKDAVNELVKPLSDELKRIETARAESQGSLTQQLESLAKNSNALTEETRNLANALKRPEVRGSWGEMQLRRVVELAGMSSYCDYEEQVSVTSNDGRNDRPDMVVRMPNERTIVIDAKTPMDAYLTAIESDTPEQRELAIEKHAKQVKDRASGLAQKSYQKIFERSPDFVVMFLPGEFLLQPALEKDRDLLDWAMQRNVIIATPNTLMALLKAVAMGWKEAQIEEEAMKIGELGKELHNRLYTFGTHMEKVRGSLNQTVLHFNRSVGSLESRVFPSARRFKELGISTSNEIPSIPEIEQSTRQLRALSAGD